MLSNARSDEDIEILANLNRKLIQDEGSENRMSDAELKSRMVKWIKTEEYKAFFINCRASTVIGYILWKEEEKEVYLRQMYVHPESRRSGIGRSAVKEFMRRIPSNKPCRLDALSSNLTALNFWKACGFVEYAVIFRKGVV